MKPIWLTNADYAQLHLFVMAHRVHFGNRAVETLSHELQRAELVASVDIPADVVTMNSRVRLRELKSGTELDVTLVYPKDADVGARKISILAPVATAVLGCRVGDEVCWPVPQGTVTYRVEAILYQPEAASKVAATSVSG
ncbi:nucleoside diphosphate kinase regulator [Hymenobacter cavernae]|uniref:Transcription elongation factor GreA/GreB C-terminal domain-containing protein n=1 Tax=Hymenobacter cavernae TaxID=2044852 RepID=A0ABQ1TZW8_9BACT|nr:nucleoside diphosphate kinase regulator [Hymenobacter cavernae]GGF08002.1 hypothetical protein GCM10011383_18910 [Hymenobacter cavernae]